MPRGNDDSVEWMPVIARALAYLCLHEGELTQKSMVEQAEFLGRLGLPRKEAAQLLGTTDDSLRVMAHQRARKTTKATKAAKR